MHEQTSLLRAADAISRHISRIPFLKFGEGENQLVLCYRKRGQIIEDEECDSDSEALQSGVFRRFRKISGDVEGFTWMRISSISDDEILDALIERFHSMSHVDIESLPLDAAYQVMQYEQATSRAARRRSPSP
ncbi:hypothetical protein G6L37_02085 [Agrobacterium rubi]|nr:hypothetical protein [Agrobacterium rubi]NTF24183.1 hypothetical protein [Agrobacterium rubi]